MISIPSLILPRLFSVPVEQGSNPFSCLTGMQRVLPHTVGLSS